MKASICYFALILLLGCTTLFSQVNSNYDGPKPEVRAGAKSLVFQYTPFQSNLEPVYVGTVSVPDQGFTSLDLMGAGFRYFVTNQIAIALGLSFGTSSSSVETETGNKKGRGVSVSHFLFYGQFL